MKKTLSCIMSCLILLISSAQVPNQINYQGIARNSVGNVLPNQPITVKLSIRDGSATGTVVYTETRNVTTNTFGLFFYGIGSPGATAVTGTLGGVNWATGNKYLQVEMDPKGGTSFTDAGTTQLLSVPYAFYAAGAPPTGNAGGSLTGTYPNPTIANGVITMAMIAPGVIPTTLPPSGPAGGSLTGNYPNPLIATSAIMQAMIAPGVTLPPSGPAGGDLTGTYPNPTVSKIQGRSINTTVPVINNVLGFDGTNWGPVGLSSITDIVWTLNGTNIYNNNTGNVGIGTNTPAYKLHVIGGHANFSDSVIAKSMRVGPGANTAISAIGIRNGVVAYGSEVGVRGEGENGVVGQGDFSGISGHSQNGRGVNGSSINGIGVYGYAPTGLKGEGGYTGVYGSGTGVGVTGTGFEGVSGTGTFAGVSGHSTNGIGTRGVSNNNYGGYFYSSSGTGLLAETARSDNNYAAVFNGNVYTYGAYQPSDRQLKKNIQDLGDAMSLIKQLKPKIYEFLNDGKLSNLHLPKGKHYGVLSQELEEILPTLVKEVENEVFPRLATDPASVSQVSVEAIEKIKIKAVNYTELIPIMIKGMQEQQQTIEEQKNKISSLEARLRLIESMLSTGSKK